jgi:hypothetical protein
VIIDCSRSKSIAYDVLELIRDYETNAKLKNITVQKISFTETGEAPQGSTPEHKREQALRRAADAGVPTAQS